MALWPAPNPATGCLLQRRTPSVGRLTDAAARPSKIRETTGTMHHTAHPGSAGRPRPVDSVRPADGYVFSRAPMLIYWELTRACGLACRHCRAEAVPSRSPVELTTAEGVALLDAMLGFGRPLPHLVFTGGDPLRRPDLIWLISSATDRGIGSSLAPSATTELSPAILSEAKAAGIQTMSLSLDGSDAARHDAFRGVAGTFATTIRAAGWASDLALPLQVNTLVTNETLDDLPPIYELLLSLGIARWSLFFLISVGRGGALREITPAESERLCHWLYDRSKEAPFAIKTTEAHHYRRIAIRRMTAEGLDAESIARSSIGRGFGIRDGNGIMFIGHDGSVYPSGFLPLAAGNVRRSDVVALYRESDLFVRLRDVGRLKGRCGRCPFNRFCGGSRARAFARTGDELESDPLCPFVPPPAAAGGRSGGIGIAGPTA